MNRRPLLFLSVFWWAFQVLCIDGLRANDAYPPEIAAWTDKDIAGFMQAGASLKQRLDEAIREGKKEFTIPPGNYFFESKTPVFRLQRVEGLTINGAGATLWFDPAQQAIVLEKCRNVVLRGLTIDYYPLPFSQGRIMAVNEADKSLDIEIEEGFPVPDNAKWVKRVGAIKAIFFDPEGEHMREARMDYVSAFQPLEGRRLRVRFKESRIFEKPVSVAVGDRLAIPLRDQPSVYANDGSSGILLEDLTIHAAGNFALYEEPGDGGNIYRRCKVVRRPGTKRLMACNADVFHVNTAGKGPLVDGCEFSYAGDDLVNIHSLFIIATKQTGPRKFVVVNHYARPPEVGQKLQIFDFFSFEPLGEPTVIAVHPVGGTAADASEVSAAIRARKGKIRDFKPPVSFLEIEIDQDLAVPEFAMVGVEKSGAPGTVVKDSYFHDNMTRGMLLRGADVLVEGNRFAYTGLTALHIGGDRPWLEGPTPRRITIRNNTFTNCTFMKNARENRVNACATISVITSEDDEFTRKQIYARDIVIENNKIDRTSLAAIAVVGADGCKITGNQINEPCLRESSRPKGSPVASDYAISVTNVSRIELNNNRISAPGPFFKGDLFLGRWVSGTLDGKAITSQEK